MAAAAAYPPWVMFEHFCILEFQGSSSTIGDANTMASCRTTAGHPIPIAVSLCLAAPPEGPRVCVHLPYDDVEARYARVFAAHGDSVVVQVGGIKNRGAFSSSTEPPDNFVYSAGDAAAEPPRPPSLSLLAPHSISYEEDKRHPAFRHLVHGRGCRYLNRDSTGLLRHGDGDGGDFLVAELKMEDAMETDPSHDKMRKEAVLHLLRSGSGEWCVKRPVIRRYADGGECVNLASSWRTSIVVPVGDRVLCWVDLMRGLLFSDDVFDESPSLRYVFDGYKGLPRVLLDYPVVSMDEPDVICFTVCENHHENDGDDTTWRVMVDMKSKTLRSVFRYPDPKERRIWSREHLLPSRVSKYFNSKPSSGQPPVPTGGPAAQAEAMLNLTNTRTMPAAASPESAILAALREIPGLDRDDMLKAYRILTHDDSGRQFRSLMGLPMDLRKDCVLMEIKATEACVLCSACSADMQLKE